MRIRRHNINIRLNIFKESVRIINNIGLKNHELLKMRLEKGRTQKKKIFLSNNN